MVSFLDNEGRLFKFVEVFFGILEDERPNKSGMDPGGMGGPDPKLLNGMAQIHAQFVENESKMSKITLYPLPPKISGSTPDQIRARLPSSASKMPDFYFIFCPKFNLYKRITDQKECFGH